MDVLQYIAGELGVEQRGGRDTILRNIRNPNKGVLLRCLVCLKQRDQVILKINYMKRFIRNWSWVPKMIQTVLQQTVHPKKEKKRRGAGMLDTG